MGTLQGIVVDQTSGPSSGSGGPQAVSGCSELFFLVFWNHNKKIFFCSTTIGGSHQRLQRKHETNITSCKKLCQPFQGSRCSMEFSEVSQYESS